MYMRTHLRIVIRQVALFCSVTLGALIGFTATSQKDYADHNIFSVVHADIPDGSGGGSGGDTGCSACCGASNSNGDPGSGSDGGGCSSGGGGDGGGCSCY